MHTYSNVNSSAKDTLWSVSETDNEMSSELQSTGRLFHAAGLLTERLWAL